MPYFKPTHIVEIYGESIPLQLCSDSSGAGPAYTESEWISDTAANFERDADGNWKFLDKPFTGHVFNI
jgi:hypothetical protein